MSPQQAIDYFGSHADVAAVCRVTRTAVYNWERRGWIPYDKQCLLQVESERAPKKKRRITASWHDVPTERRPEKRAA